MQRGPVIIPLIPKKKGQEVSQTTRRLGRLPRVLQDLQMEWLGRDEVELKDYNHRS